MPKKLLLSAGLLVCTNFDAYAQPKKIVACDLATSQVAEAVLGSPIAQHAPNREVQQVEGAAWSTCVFFAKRLSLNSTLSSRAARHAVMGRRHGWTQAS